MIDQTPVATVSLECPTRGELRHHMRDHYLTDAFIAIPDAMGTHTFARLDADAFDRDYVDAPCSDIGLNVDARLLFTADTVRVWLFPR